MPPQDYFGKKNKACFSVLPYIQSSSAFELEHYQYNSQANIPGLVRLRGKEWNEFAGGFLLAIISFFRYFGKIIDHDIFNRMKSAEMQEGIFMFYWDFAVNLIFLFLNQRKFMQSPKKEFAFFFFLMST